MKSIKNPRLDQMRYITIRLMKQCKGKINYNINDINDCRYSHLFHISIQSPEKMAKEALSKGKQLLVKVKRAQLG